MGVWGIRKYFSMEGAHLSAESRMTVPSIRQIRCRKGVLDGGNCLGKGVEVEWLSLEGEPPAAQKDRHMGEWWAGCRAQCSGSSPR